MHFHNHTALLARCGHYVMLSYCFTVNFTSKNHKKWMRVGFLLPRVTYTFNIQLILCSISFLNIEKIQRINWAKVRLFVCLSFCLLVCAPYIDSLNRSILTNRARSGTNRFKIIRGVPNKTNRKYSEHLSRDLVIADQKKIELRVVPTDSEFYRE